MRFDDSLSARLENAILVDEVGIEIGRHGPYFLKTLYRPVFRKSEAGLVPCGVAGATSTFRSAGPVAMKAFLEDVLPEDRLFVDCLCRALQLRNHRNIGVEGLRLFLGHSPTIDEEPETALAQIDVLAACLPQAEVDPALVVWGIGEGPDDGTRAMADALRRHKLGVALDDFGMGETALVRVGLLDPDIVKVNGLWFRRIAEVAVAARLLASLVDALQREGRQVLIEGIASPAHLRAALDAGADFLQGDLLCPPRLAGAYFEMEPLDAERLVATDEKVIPIFANRNGPV